MSEGRDYLLGMAPAEVERLGRQHDVWRDDTTRAWDLGGFREGQTIVDLGAGPGFTSLDLAARVGPAGRVIAVDSSQVATRYLLAKAAQNGVSNLDVVCADVEHVDLAGWNPDGVFARWLFCFLPDPKAVVRHIASAIGAGATMVLIDYWNYLAIRTEPDSPLFRKVFQAVFESFADAGGSLEVAGKLPALLEANGLTVTAIEPLCRVGRPRSPTWRWISEFQELYLQTLVEKQYLTTADLEAYRRWWQDQTGNPAAFVFSPPMLCVVGVKR
jgi:SAM-dependent methyltransferase